MRLPFLDRREELSRLRALLGRREGGLGVLYGRRRCGKSRLLLEALGGRPAVFFVADDRVGDLGSVSPRWARHLAPLVRPQGRAPCASVKGSGRGRSQN